MTMNFNDALEQARIVLAAALGFDPQSITVTVGFTTATIAPAKYIPPTFTPSLQAREKPQRYVGRRFYMCNPLHSNRITIWHVVAVTRTQLKYVNEESKTVPRRKQIQSIEYFESRLIGDVTKTYLG